MLQIKIIQHIPRWWEMRWPFGLSVLVSDRVVGIAALLGILCCVLKQNSLLSHCLSPPWCIMGTRELNAGGNPCNGLDPILKGVEILLLAYYAIEAGTAQTCSGSLGSYADSTFFTFLNYTRPLNLNS